MYEASVVAYAQSMVWMKKLGEFDRAGGIVAYRRRNGRFLAGLGWVDRDVGTSGGTVGVGGALVDGSAGVAFAVATGVTVE